MDVYVNFVFCTNLKNLKFRKENNIDNILKEDWSDVMRDFPATIDTYDKEGRPSKLHICIGLAILFEI